MKLEEYYDSVSLMFPERILEDLFETKKRTEEAIDSLIEQREIYKDILSELSNGINISTYDLKAKENKIKALEENIEEKERYEIELARRVSKQLLENYDGSLLNHSWFTNKYNSLIYIEEKKKSNLEDVQRFIWEKSIDKLLNKEDYFIPNKDIVLIKEGINGIGIHAETGAEYLNGLNDKEKEEILGYYPGFLYSVVIANERDWELIDKNIGRGLFLNNMVPIYIRSEMKSRDNSFKVILGKAYELVEKSSYESWKAHMEEEFKELADTENNIRKDLNNIENIKQELIFIAKNDTAYILNQRLKDFKKDILEITDKIKTYEEEKLNYENLIYRIEKELNRNNIELDNINFSVQRIQAYIKMVKEVEKERIEILKIKENLSQINIETSNLQYDNESVQDNQNRVRESYNEWKVKIKYIIEDLKSVSKDVVYEPKIDYDYINFKIPDFSASNDILRVLIKERKVLEEDIRTKNNKIVKIDADIEYLNKDISRNIKELIKLDNNWIRYPKLKLSPNEIIMKIEEIKKAIKILEKERENIKSVLDSSLGSIGTIKEVFETKGKQILKDHKRSPIILEIENFSSEIDIVNRDIESNKKYLTLCIEEIEKNKDTKYRLQNNLAKIKTGYELEWTKGKMDRILKEKIQNNADLIVDDWIHRCLSNEREIKKTVDEGERYRSEFIKKINIRLEEDKLKEQIVSTVKEANINNFKNNIISFRSMKSHFENEILTLSKDKEKAENAMKQWSDRASIYVIRMIEGLKDMVASMNYTNEQDYVFPLVKLKGADRLPKAESEIIHLLEEYFVESITKILETNENIDKIDGKILNELMGDKVIFSKALQGRYPTLLVYKMSEKNEFKFARPREEYYTTWEAINKGEGDLPEGSGGQTLSVNTFVIMMIMSFKKKHIGNENPSTVLILDNPFGKASAKHVLDPIFEIADKLNFQLICFAAPEIIKVEISERFPIFWELKIEDGKVIHGGRIIK
ncbi:hypothetical protein [Tissierella praeacuta]|uniref:hypothetical protein n=1 Tax=Tissierella praeacuta TaxID=43131 RepID=UPI00333F10CC